MKRILLTVFLSFLCFNNIAKAQDPTYAGLPDSSHVLVVYNSLSDTSRFIKNYYQNARGIPESNIVPLDNLFDDNIYDPLTGTTHSIEIRQDGEIILDAFNEDNEIASATRHAWIYFNNRIAIPIANHLKSTVVNGDTLKDIIRFIVLCKDIPFRVHSRWAEWSSHSFRQNVPVDGLLCLLGETIEDPEALLEYLNEGWANSSPYGISNPYFNADQNFSMGHYFLPNHYKGTAVVFGETRDISFSYLITHLDAPRLIDVRGMIDRSLDAINSIDYDWFIDADPTPCEGGSYLSHQITATRNVFNLLDITNYKFDNTETILYNHIKSIMSYSSNGIHTNIGPPPPPPAPCIPDLPPDYIQSQLLFTYAPGAFFNTMESFNGETIGTYPVFRSSGHGQIADFIYKGGTVGVGSAYELLSSQKTANSIMFPSYALGYTFIEAAYLGLSALTDEFVIVGDPLTRITVPCEPLVLTSNTTISSGDYDCPIVVPDSITLRIESGSTVNFNRGGSIEVYGNLIIEPNSNINLNNVSFINIYVDGTAEVNSGSILTLNNKSKVTINGEININDGSTLNLNHSSQFTINESLILNNATVYLNDNCIIQLLKNFTAEYSIFNFESSANKILYDGSGILEIDNCDFTNGELVVYSEAVQTPFIINISSSEFSNTYVELNSRLFYDVETNLVNNTFNNIGSTAVRAAGIKTLFISGNIFNGISMEDVTAIKLEVSGDAKIEYCDISNTDIGITVFERELEVGEESEFIGIDISNTTIDNSNKGIQITDNLENLSALEIKSTTVNDCNSGIVLSNISDFSPLLKDNIITNCSDYGLSGSLLDLILIQNCTLTDNEIGVYLSQVNEPSIIENTITANGLPDPGAGIVFVSCDGEIRKNSISGHLNGIEIGGSSPDVAENTITDNDYYGIYVSGNSNPDLGKTIIGEYEYPLTGYNEIRENGICTWPLGYAEIYIDQSSIKLSKGCNTIADDRVSQPLNCDYTLLLDGEADEIIYADSNYWGDHPVYGNNPSQRFGAGLSVWYLPYLTRSCTYNAGGDFLVMTNSQGTVIDTVYSSGTAPANLSDIESRYAAANSFYYAKDYSSAKQEYQQIIQNYGDSISSVKAYNKLYTIEKLVSSTTQSFTQLRSFYQQKLSTLTDSILIGTLNHLSNLCLVAEGQYQDAISEFDEVVQNNPNTDLALYGEIDALTTALLLPPDSTLGKGTLGKYVVGDISDYTSRVNQLLKNRGRSSTETEKENIPDQYYLYQNYPNPFNPVTTIKYDVPKPGNIELIIYDILGRKVTTLINEQKQPGRYEAVWNASIVASGVYIYQVRANDFVDNKKMILLK